MSHLLTKKPTEAELEASVKKERELTKFFRRGAKEDSEGFSPLIIPSLLKDCGADVVRSILSDNEAVADFAKIFSEKVQAKDMKISALVGLIKNVGVSLVWRVLGSRRFGIGRAELKEAQFAAFMEAYKGIKWNGDYAKDNDDKVKISFANAFSALRK